MRPVPKQVIRCRPSSVRNRSNRPSATSGDHVIGANLHDQLMKPVAVTNLVEDLNAPEVQDLQAWLRQLARDCGPDSDVTLWASILWRAGLGQSRIAIRID